MKLQCILFLWVPLLRFENIVHAISTCPTTLCTCQGEDIICSSRGLRAVPTFSETLVKYRNIYLDNNRITTIRSDDFANLVTFEEVYIRLSHNSITVIQDDAFSRLGNVTLRLELNGNMKQFDNFLRNLTIRELSLDGVSSLDITTMFALGANLKTLYIGMERISDWPEGFKSMRYLTNLTLSGLTMTTIPDTAFHSFESSLRHLRIQYSSLPRLPDAICFLRHIESVTLVRRQTSASSALAPYCQTPMSSVRYLTVDDDRLTDFPDVFHTFNYLQHLNITTNPNLRYIRQEAFPNRTSVSSLNLSKNGFRQVPWAIRSLRYLRDLDLSYNEISTIEGNDFSGLPPISRLVLAGNPIDYLSSTAFSPVNAIKFLDLRHTNITSIPRAILSLNSPSIIDLRDNRIECSCDLLWIKSWALKFSSSILGNCFFSTESISSFVSNDLIGC